VRLIRSSADDWRAANRAAFELASLIQNDPKLAADPRLLGEMTDLLEHKLTQGDDPKMTQYVALAIGQFATLDAVASNGQKVDPIAALDRALDPRYPSGIRIAAAAGLAKHAARMKGALDDPRAIEALLKASEQGDPEFRQMAVYALGFFGGERAVDALLERLGDADRFVRYNAAVALARRGHSAAVPTLQEMLTPSALEQAILSESPTEKRAQAEAIELEALQAIQSSIREGKPGLARSLRPALESEANSGLVSVRNSAQAVLKSLP
jgi:HEAT repeat protein